MKTQNWPGGIDLSHSNHTLRFPRVSRYDGVGGWAKDSSTPPWGWPVAIGIALVVAVLFFYGPTLAARWLL